MHIYMCCTFSLYFSTSLSIRGFFRPFNFGSSDVQTETVVSAVWQLAAFPAILSKQCPYQLLQIYQYFKNFGLQENKFFKHN